MSAKAIDKLEEANRLIFVKQYALADKIISELLHHETHRDDLLIHLRRIELATKLGRLGDLQSEYRKAVVKNPESTTSKIALVMTEQHAEFIEPEEATARYQALLKEVGPHPAIFYGIGFSMELQGNLERAAFNYQQCVSTDPAWYPGYFGLSQVNYQLGDEKQGDYFFFLFEEAAPYNVYGNFDTHRRLANEYLELEKFAESEAAITALSEWWVENKNQCPPEIQVYEFLMLARISERKGDWEQCEFRRRQALLTATKTLEDDKAGEGVLYFLAKTLEEFSEFELAFRFYKKILSREGANPEVVQKIGGQFLSLGEYRLAKELFAEAYVHHPENPEVRFCRLVADLKLEGVNVEEYLIGKERMKQLVQNPSDKVELLSLLHTLMAKYKNDPDVHGAVGEVYLRLGNLERAGRHYKQMFDLDPHSRLSALRYSSYLMQYGDPEEAKKVLDGITRLETLSSEDRAEVNWLKATYFSRHRDYGKSQQILAKVIALDPWNVSYLIQEIHNLTLALAPDEDLAYVDSVVEKLYKNDENELDWQEFDQRTALYESAHKLELAYARQKLKFLYSNGAEGALRYLVKVACKFDARRSTYEFLRLLNTNFDSPSIYWALGMMFKEMWQLETASMWFEQVLFYPEENREQMARAYLELADCYVWRNVNLPKAVEYAKLALDMVESRDSQTTNVLSHALLKNGQIKQAQVLLEESTKDSDLEAIFLRGLVHYRNGAEQTANKIWKPLLTVRSESMRFHNIKQEVLKFYFDKAPYLEVN